MRYAQRDREQLSGVAIVRQEQVLKILEYQALVLILLHSLRSANTSYTHRATEESMELLFLAFGG